LYSVKVLAKRWAGLDAQIVELDTRLGVLVADVAPNLLKVFGVGTHTAAALLICAGDNPDRLHSSAGFAALCGVTLIQASSGQTRRHRLNRGGNRQANNALWTIAMTRLAFDERTKTYAARRTAEGLSKREIIRCLKRAIARELFPIIVSELNQHRCEPSA
jgi:transposase